MKTEAAPSNRITLVLTPLQLKALWRLVDFANHDGDAANWHRSAGAKPAELRAMGQVMEIVGKAARRPAQRGMMI